MCNSVIRDCSHDVKLLIKRINKYPNTVQYIHVYIYRNRDSSVGIAAPWTAGVLFPAGAASRPVLGPAQHPIQWVPRLLPVVKRPGRDAKQSHVVPRLRMVEVYLHCTIYLHGEGKKVEAIPVTGRGGP
jgi:hypothetical protein